MLNDVVVVVRTCPRAIPLTIFAMRKEIQGFFHENGAPSLRSFGSPELRYNYGAALGGPKGNTRLR